MARLLEITRGVSHLGFALRLVAELAVSEHKPPATPRLERSTRPLEQIPFQLYGPIQTHVHVHVHVRACTLHTHYVVHIVIPLHI